MDWANLLAPLWYFAMALVVVSQRLLMENPNGAKIDGVVPKTTFVLASVCLFFGAASYEFQLGISYELQLYGPVLMIVHVMATNAIRFVAIVKREPANRL